MNNLSRFYLKYSWLIYVFISLLSGFILFCPMLIAIFSDYNFVSNIAYNPTNNLVSTIIIMILVILLTLIYSFFQYKNFSYYPIKIWYKKFFVNIFVIIFQCLISFVVFMIIWLVPINIHSDNVYKVVSELRITLYASLGSIIVFISLLTTLFLNLYIKYGILYTIKKEKDDRTTM